MRRAVVSKVIACTNATPGLVGPPGTGQRATVPTGPGTTPSSSCFDGGALHPEQIDAIKISDQELDAFRFCTDAEASDLLRPYVWSRATLALDALRTGRTHYAHFGAAISDGIDR
jgi:hypothetical protein